LNSGFKGLIFATYPFSAQSLPPGQKGGSSSSHLKGLQPLQPL
jgi:hypothetical protein